MGILDKISKKGDKEDVKKVAPKKAEKKAEGKKPTAKKKAPKKEGKKTPSKAEGKKTEESKAEEKKDKGVEKKGSRPEASFAYNIICHPVSTEKTDRLKMNHGKYTFMVAKGANKVEIARAVKELYGVSPVSVRVMNIKGKKVRYGRIQGSRKDTRKAVVTLKEGDSISLAE
jgi:large subunit ribosomal protein L23